MEEVSHKYEKRKSSGDICPRYELMNGKIMRSAHRIRVVMASVCQKFNSEHESGVDAYNSLFIDDMVVIAAVATMSQEVREQPCHNC